MSDPAAKNADDMLAKYGMPKTEQLLLMMLALAYSCGGRNMAEQIKKDLAQKEKL